ncbi:MAG: helix-turn-helix domain-containing protein [Gemmatimonadaceae bacterium]|jgi:transcriptional regulator with XRE-family HTH domain
MTQPFGAFVRQRREALAANPRDFSLRQVAGRIGVEPAYLSKVERDEVAPPSEDTIRRLAEDLGGDPDVFLGACGSSSVGAPASTKAGDPSLPHRYTPSSTRSRGRGQATTATSR